MAGEDGEPPPSRDEARIEWLPPAPEGSEPPRFDPDRPDPLAQPPPPPPPSLPASGPPTRATAPPPAWQQTPSRPWPEPYGKRPGNGAAIASLWTGVAGLVLFVFPAGFGLVFIFNLPCSILAWVLGVQGRRKVERGETHEHGATARTGTILGMVGVILGVLAVVGWALAIALSEEVRDELRRAIEEGREQ